MCTPRYIHVFLAGLGAALLMFLVGCADNGTPSNANPLPSGGSNAAPAPADLLNILKTGYEEPWPGSARPPSITEGSLRRLGSNDGLTYFAGLNDDAHICLIAFAGTDDSTLGAEGFETAMGCSSLQRFETHAGSLGLVTPDTKRMAYLLPDGFAEAARSLSWAEVVSPNLLVVTDFEARPRGEIRLKSASGGLLALVPSLP